MNNSGLISLSDGIDPPAQQIQCKFIEVKGRQEHESILNDPERCKELGIDLYYERMVYLKRWGSWLDEKET